jgi:hypothetical protein
MTDVQTWTFSRFWQLLNQELAAIGEAEADFADARYYYDSIRDYSPYSAAQLIAEDRRSRWIMAGGREG